MHDLTDFQIAFVEQIGFEATPIDGGLRLSNPNAPEQGSILVYQKKGAFAFYHFDYTMPQTFTLSFDGPGRFLRYGQIHQGISNFFTHEEGHMHLTPTSFITYENQISGRQTWQQGDRYHGMELLVFSTYLEEILGPNHPELLALLTLKPNHIYRYLPLEIVDVLRDLQKASVKKQLTPLYLSAKVHESLALLERELNTTSSPFKSHPFIDNVKGPGGRVIRLSGSDVAAVYKARKLIEAHIKEPLTIRALSKSVYLNEQKLTAGFRHIYHMTIGHYIKEYRLTVAANLLTTTELSIEEIATMTGYSHPSNFAKAYRKKYLTTPLHYRKSH